jgi:predicted nucleic acid-binding protein
MAYLIDTGVLLRVFDSANAECATIRAAWRHLNQRGETIAVAIQNIAEFWNVSTRPVSPNGYGVPQQRTRRRVEIIEQNCWLLTESINSYLIWKRLVESQATIGVAVHDARLASVMIAEGIHSIVTLNERDFRRFPNITPLSPSDVLKIG